MIASYTWIHVVFSEDKSTTLFKAKIDQYSYINTPPSSPPSFLALSKGPEHHNKTCILFFKWKINKNKMEKKWKNERKKKKMKKKLGRPQTSGQSVEYNQTTFFFLPNLGIISVNMRWTTFYAKCTCKTWVMYIVCTYRYATVVFCTWNKKCSVRAHQFSAK